MPAELLDLTFDPGETANWECQYLQGEGEPPVDLTGCSASLLVTPRDGSAPVLMDTANGGVILGGAAGTITLDLSFPAYQAIPAGQHNYALDLIQGAEIMPFLRGKWLIRP